MLSALGSQRPAVDLDRFGGVEYRTRFTNGTAERLVQTINLVYRIYI